MPSTDATRQTLLAWLESARALEGRTAIESTGTSTGTARAWLHDITEEPASAHRIVSLVADARARGLIAGDSVSMQQWLLVREALDALDSPVMRGLGEAARRLTCEEIATYVRDDAETRAVLNASGVRFREFAKIVTGRRFCAGIFHWEECGIRRSWLAKVPPRDLAGCGWMLLKMGGFGPVMFPHLNPRRLSIRLEEPDISVSLAAFAESLDRRLDLRGFAAASWLRSPDTHRVSPHLAALNATILANGGFVTTVGPAPEDCGVFARSRTRRRLYDEGLFTPTIGLVLWPRADMLRWWRGHPAFAVVEAA